MCVYYYYYSRDGKKELNDLLNNVPIFVHLHMSYVRTKVFMTDTSIGVPGWTIRDRLDIGVPGWMLERD